jgi:nucleotide-binding universal stress UspA family protein
MAHRILVCLDGSLRSEAAIPYALSCARDAELILVQVPMPVYVAPRLIPRAYRELVEGLALKVAGSLESLASELKGRGFRASVRTPLGRPDDAVCSLAEAERADLIVLTSHGRTGWKRCLLGSVAEKIVRHSNVPVMLIPTDDARETDWRESELPEFRGVVVPLDGSELSESALGFREVLALEPAQVHLVQATDIPSYIPRDLLDPEVIQGMLRRSEEYLTGILSRHASLAPELTCRACDLPAAEAVLLAADTVEADLIAMATRGRDGLGRVLMGSVAETVARQAACPVLLMPPGNVTSCIRKEAGVV